VLTLPLCFPRQTRPESFTGEPAFTVGRSVLLLFQRCLSRTVLLPERLTGSLLLRRLANQNSPARDQSAL